MGTRGLMGVRIGGVDKLTYNHWDSYPSRLGNDIVTYLKEIVNMDEEVEKVKSLRLVSEDGKPTTEDIEKFNKHANINVGEKKFDSWYCLLRELQGKLGETLSSGVMIDSRDFIDDSLFCEWAYIVNFDEMVLEVYKGYQQASHDKGRYASAVGIREFYPCALIKTFPLNDLPYDLKLAVGEEE